MDKKIPLIAVIGPTASGKTGLAVEIAKKFGGEVVSADSMQIYSELTVGTAKPTEKEMEGVPHHLIGHKSIDEEYSVVDYVEEAKNAIADIFSRGKLPVLCGGTGLYVDSLLSNTEFSEIKSDPDVRKKLYDFAEENGNEALFEKLKEIDPETAAKTHANNLIRVVRAMEVYEVTGKTMSEHQKDSHPIPSIYDVCYIGTNFSDRDKLYARIEQRIDEMLEEG
ncbi:MAG: tRNA (adenosine(37)-N6)-dimethylallyltransferase MiaA, partial [Oscillospiraceae bacterium]|nr:tRNA (adenosine(37)-N6)-dimethylallyltransferase MiaA [Oscillospiraceae bacterium]